MNVWPLTTLSSRDDAILRSGRASGMKIAKGDTGWIINPIVPLT